MGETGLESVGLNKDKEQRDSNYRKRIFGFVVLLLGLSQVIVGFNYNPTSHLEFIVLVGGGWLLIGFGGGLLLEKDLLPGESKSRAIDWIITIALLVITIVIFVLSISTSLPN